MSIHAVLQAVHDTWLGQFTRAYAPVFTTGLVVHFIGLCRLRLWSRTDGVGEVAPNNRAGGPPLRSQAGSTSNRLERTDRFLPWGARFLICRT